ncbi:MAG: NfeD family protein [Acidimicrobiales bacterium]|nr:NfeD family protein [Acidimicrobiales bacterium]RZV43529.1 MAG: hypothetical protein EX269_13110 [Acidimicrobiales bacterium]
MLALYIFCAALGVPLLALFAFGGSEADADAGLELDAGGDVGFDVDGDLGGFDADAGGFDADVDAAADFGAGDVQGVGDITALFRRIPVSSWSFLLSFFGVMGLVGTGLGFGTIATFIFALVLGLIAGGVNTAAFSFLRKTDMSSHFTDRQLSGRIATVSVPIEDGKRGRVWIDTGDERVQLTANAAEGDDEPFMRGDQVVIIDVHNSIAKVTRAPELED